MTTNQPDFEGARKAIQNAVDNGVITTEERDDGYHWLVCRERDSGRMICEQRLEQHEEWDGKTPPEIHLG